MDNVSTSDATADFPVPRGFAATPLADHSN